MQTKQSEIVLNVEYCRSKFPALKNNFVFMDNAGGSQALQGVIDRIGYFMNHYNVQLGASYSVSANATEQLEKATAVIGELVNASRPEEVIIGPSTTMLLRILSICLSRQWQKGDEIIVTNSDHEANVSCWFDLEEKGMKVKVWRINPDSLTFDLEDLNNLITDKTKLVTMVHASNILGTINPIREIANMVHDAGVLFCVDGVAYAPHRLLDMQEFDADFYAYSFYKTFGPHQAVLFGKYDLLKEMDGFNHYFVGKSEVPYKFQPGNFNFELTYSLTGITDYLIRLHDHHFPDETGYKSRGKYNRSYQLIADHEEELVSYILDYLNNIPEVKIIGNTHENKNNRVSTVSFIHNKFSSSDIVSKVDSHNIGIRYGDFYAKKIIEDLNLIDKDGVVRVSMVHYNTKEEVDRLIEVFKQIL